MQTKQRSAKYRTAGELTIYRASVSVPYDKALDEIGRELDERRGALFSSTVDFPGRYSRWDVGFINPPLQVEGRERRFSVNALNSRGRAMLSFLRPVLEQCVALTDLVCTEHSLAGELRPARLVRFEEERSRQYSFFSVLREIIAFFHSEADSILGLYGAFGYELAFQFEAVKTRLSRDPDTRNLVLYLPDEILLVDHRKEIASRHSYDFECGTHTTCQLPRDGKVTPFRFAGAAQTVEACDHRPGEYADTVRRALAAFARGDMFEAVPGQMFREKCIDSPAAIFSRLRQHNPSPYGAFINLGEREYLVAASPEMYVRVEGNRVETCPISGTIARGDNAIEDAAQIRKLLNSLKDESELSMCTDVDRNDKARVCQPGSVRVIGRRQVELYSRLIHTVDHVEGRLRAEFDALDAFLSHTWAVTVTGAPKQSAIQFIEDHEKSPRRWYGGAMGFLKFNGDINTGLTLRTIRIDHGVAEIRAGATLLYDSDPDAEEAETRLKASALLSAIRNDYPLASEATPVAGECDIELLMVDHHDSFVHTLASYFRECGARVTTVRPEFVAGMLEERRPDLVVLSPGPGRPADFALDRTLSLALARDIPVFGVCLGLQGIVEFFGGKLDTLDYPVHGKASIIRQGSGDLFAGIKLPLEVGRYHSLVAAEVPACLKVTAVTEDDRVMAVEHRDLPVSAVQFHPESILSMEKGAGMAIIRNVVTRVARGLIKESREDVG